MTTPITPLLPTLEIYDELAMAARTGRAYVSRLDPPPADPRVAHPESSRPDWAKDGARESGRGESPRRD